MVKSEKDSEQLESMRLDKWLKVARLFKTRTLAATACQSHHVKVNGKKVKPAQMIKIGDTISIQYPSRNRTFDVAALTQRSISATAARELYLEHLPAVTPESQKMFELFLQQENRRQRERQGKGRPTKKERRELVKIKGK